MSEAGKPVNKSSQKTSWMLGMNYADEPLPPMVVLPSSAESPKYRKHFIANMQQVSGQFGYCGVRTFSSVVLASENPSVSNKILLCMDVRVACVFIPRR